LTTFLPITILFQKNKNRNENMKAKLRRKSVMMTYKYVSRLTKAQREHLQEMMEKDTSARVRKRAHSILLSDDGFTIEEIQTICFVNDRDTVSGWIDAWEERGIEGLSDRPRSGRPPALNEEERATALEYIKASRRQLKQVIQRLADQYGKTVSVSPLKRVAKAAKGVWKRIRRSLRSKRNQAQFDATKTILEDLRRRQQRGEIGLFSFDECGLTLEPPVPYAWQFPDEQLEMPSSTSRRLNVLGFLSPDMLFHSFVFECSVNSDVVIACFDWLSDHITQDTWVVIDNAPMHTSNAFEDKMPEWKAKGLFIQRLPTYSPELNLIEILWRFITYFWLPFSAYESFQSLVQAVEDILRQVGTEYCIHFKELEVKMATP
jgi:transposase